jgi:hypothetical protein
MSGTTVAIVGAGWTVFPHLPDSSDLAPSNCNQFGPFKIRPVSATLSQWRDTEESCVPVV